MRFAICLDRLADAIGGYLQAQIEAGAVAVQLFDTWAGTLSFDDYRSFALPAARRALAHVRGAPRIYFTKDASPFLRVLRETGADVIGLDWRTTWRTRAKCSARFPSRGTSIRSRCSRRPTRSAAACTRSSAPPVRAGTS
jgi:uroporphyrinogen-III decarboxylase